MQIFEVELVDDAGEPVERFSLHSRDMAAASRAVAQAHPGATAFVHARADARDAHAYTCGAASAPH